MHQTQEPFNRSCYGQLSICQHSGGFRLDFGEMQLWLCHERLRQLARKVNQLVSVIERIDSRAFSHHHYLYPPNSGGMAFIFSFDELLDLQDLVNGSLVMVDLSDFLNDNQLTSSG